MSISNHDDLDLNRQVQLAEELFASGAFTEAEALFGAVRARDPGHRIAAARLGQLALLADRLEPAITLLRHALRLSAGAPWLAALLAEAYVRRGELEEAVPLLQAAGRPAYATKLARMSGELAYAPGNDARSTALPWVAAEPLPLVRVHIHGQPMNLILDTGAGELVLDTAWARPLGLTTVSSERGGFAGGRSATVHHVWVEELQLGDVVLQRVPAQVCDLTAIFSPFFPGIPVHGVLGTALLYHFNAVIDHVRGELRLRLRGVAGPVPSRAASCTVPFWLAGDHYILVDAHANGGHPGLMFVDTGMTGAALAAPPATCHTLGTTMTTDRHHTGYGGGGEVRAYPFTLDELCLGDWCRHALSAMCLPSFPLERQFGFRIAGLLAHDFFRNCAIELDFDRMRLSLWAP